MSVAISWANKKQLARCDISVSFPKSSHIWCTERCRAHTHTNINACVHTHTLRAHICVSHTQTRAHTQTHHTHARAHTHTHTHTHTITLDFLDKVTLRNWACTILWQCTLGLTRQIFNWSGNVRLLAVITSPARAHY